jgi:hypothetical protein
MMRRPGSSLLAVLALVGVAGLAGCSRLDPIKPYRQLQAQTRPDANRIYQVVAAQPDDVYQFLVTSGGQRVELLHSPGGVWNPGQGATEETAALMQESEPALLPLLAYRRLAVDASDPAFGLIGASLTFTVQTQTAQQWQVKIGGPSPTGAGYYAQVHGDPSVYTVVPSVVNDLRSILAGKKLEGPLDPSVQQVLNSETETHDPEEVTNPWLAQVKQVDGEPSTAAP